MNYQLLQTLIQALQDFEAQMGSGELADFALWLYEKEHEEKSDWQEHGNFPDIPEIDSQLAYGIVTLFQHARHYVRTALRHSRLHGMHDFVFLATLLDDGDFRKSDLIHRNVLELSSGMEVIKRLIRKGQAEDFPDPEDGRSRRVRITKKGRKDWEDSLHQMQMASRIIAGNLEDGEKKRALAGIRKLLHFHQAVWKEDQGKELPEIINAHRGLGS